MSMETLNPEEKLQAAIEKLEIRQAEERKQLKDQMHHAYDSIKPVNLIKSTLAEISASSTLKKQLLDAAIGLSVGFISNKIYVGVSKNPVKRLVGHALMIAITNTVIRNPEAIKRISVGLYRWIKSKKNSN